MTGASARPRHGGAGARPRVAAMHLRDHAVPTMRRVLAILVAGGVAAPAVAADSCVVPPSARGHMECCRPSTAQNFAHLTCCVAPEAVTLTASARDNQRDDALAAAALEVPWYSAPTLPRTLRPASAPGLRESGAGPSLFPLRI